jgi:hypothetical protein
MVQLDVDAGRGDKQRELPGPCHAFRVVRGAEADRRLHPPVVWAALGAGVATATSQRRFLMMRWEVMSQEPLNTT